MTTTLRKLLTDNPDALGFNRGQLWAWNGDPALRPEPDDWNWASWQGLWHIKTGSYSDPMPLEDADFVQVPCTGWGDYSGSSYDRANMLALSEDFPDTFTTVRSDYGWSALLLDLDREWEDERELDYFAETLRGLADDYPLYDEDRHSQLLFDMAEEDWRGWGKHDAMRTYEEALVATGSVSPERAEELAGQAEDDGSFDKWLELTMADGQVCYEAETAVSGYFRGLEDVLKDQARRVAGADTPAHAD